MSCAHINNDHDGWQVEVHDTESQVLRMQEFPQTLLHWSQYGLGAGYQNKEARDSLLWLAAPWVCYQQCAVILQQCLLNLHLALLINILLVVGNDGLADGLTESCRGREGTTGDNSM